MGHINDILIIFKIAAGKFSIFLWVFMVFHAFLCFLMFFMLFNGFYVFFNGLYGVLVQAVSKFTLISQLFLKLGVLKTDRNRILSTKTKYKARSVFSVV